MSVYGNLSPDPTQPPPGFVPRFSAKNPYDGGAGGLEMDPTTKRLFLRQRKYVYKPQRRVDFIARNRRRIAELCKVLKPLDAERTCSADCGDTGSPALTQALYFEAADRPCSERNRFVDEKEVDRLLQYAKAIEQSEGELETCDDGIGSEAYKTIENDAFEQQLIEELKKAQDAADAQLAAYEDKRNAFVEEKKVCTGADLEYQQVTVQPSQAKEARQDAELVEFTNSMAKTTAYLEHKREQVDLDEIMAEDISKEIVRRVKQRQHGNKCDAPFLQPFLFRGRF